MASSSTIKFASEDVIDRFLASVDVWQTIFETLSVKDRMRLEMTNKRLHMLMFDYWKRVTSFDSKKCFTEMSDNPWESRNRWVALLAICVNRIGDGLRSLTIREYSPTTVWCANLPSIGKGCPNVETINFVFEDGTLDFRLNSLSRLKTIIVSAATGVKFPSVSASFFLSIPVSIEVIRGLHPKSEGCFENAAQIEGFFADRPSLREVSLSNLMTRDGSRADMFRVIAQGCPHLKSIKLKYSHYIDYRGVVALESMKELRIYQAVFDEMQIVTICERSPLVEAVEFRFRFSSNIDLQSAALNALGSLTKLRDFFLDTGYEAVVAPSLVTEFVRGLARNSGASPRLLHLCIKMPLQTAYGQLPLS